MLKVSKILFLICIVVFEVIFLFFYVVPIEFQEMLDIHTSDKMGKHDEVRVYTDTYKSNCDISYYTKNEVYNVENVYYYLQIKKHVYIIDQSSNYYVVDLESRVLTKYGNEFTKIPTFHANIFSTWYKFNDMTYLY